MVGLGDISVDLVGETHKVTIIPYFTREGAIVVEFGISSARYPNRQLDPAHSYEPVDTFDVSWKEIRQEALAKLVRGGAPQDLATAALAFVETLEKACLAVG